jgi:hypothetical protein
MRYTYRRFERGEAAVFLIIALVVGISVVTVGLNKKRTDTDVLVEGVSSSSDSIISSPTPPSNNPQNTTVSKPSIRSVSINKGNAPRSYQPYEEYISLTNRGKEAVNITGWKLKSDKDVRTYYINGSIRRLTADIVVIPKGVEFISPTGNNTPQDIVLERGERAIITTGSIGSKLPYSIVSFKENMCSGYLETMGEYSFTPKLDRSCPRPANEKGLENLDTECRKFIERLPSCMTPDFTQKNRKGEQCSSCVNGTQLSSQCVAFIKERFSYAGCIAHHQNDPKFSRNTWRVFLGMGWEMWAKDYETIYLFDEFDQLVNKISY